MSFLSGLAGESNMNVEDMDEDSSTSEEEDDDEEEAGKGEGPAAAGMKPVDAAPAVIQPSLPAPGNFEYEYSVVY